MTFKVGDVVRWNGLKAQIVAMATAPPHDARLLLFPQPGVKSGARYQDTSLSELTPWEEKSLGTVGLRELIGRSCRCVFNLPDSEWPFPGYPAWVRVLDVDLPLVKLASSHYDGGRHVWMLAALIKTIEVSE